MESTSPKQSKKRKQKATEDAGSSTAPAAATPAPTVAVVAPPAVTPSAVAPSSCDEFPTEESMPHLCCSVCLSFPEGTIMQCCAGHILCLQCYDRVIHEERPICPTCRDPLDLLKPIRNMLAEQSISRLPVRCLNEGCDAALTRGSLASHLKHDCLFRAVKCKYAPLGCKWEGIASGLSRHEDRCKRAEQPGWKLLKKVCSSSAAVAANHQAQLDEARSHFAVTDILAGRCRNVEFTSVTLYKCSAHEHVAGKPAHLVSPAFHALGFRWKLFTLAEPTAAKYCAVLQLRDCRVPLPVDFFLLRGQPLSVQLKLPSCSHTFAQRHRTCEPMTLAEGAAADHLADLETLTLRIGLVDKRSGRLDRGFMGQMGAGYSGEDDWGEDEGVASDLDGASDRSEDDFSDSGSHSHYRY